MKFGRIVLLTLIKKMNLKISIISILVLLLLSYCNSKNIKYSGFNDLVVGVQSVILYENNNFYLELGIGGVKGIYKISNDTIFLEYNKKPKN